MLWVFLAVCLLLNICIIAGYRYKVVDYPFFSYVGSAAAAVGTTLDDEFSRKLSALPDSGEKRRLAAEIEELEPIYADFNAPSLAEAYTGFYGVSGAWADLLQMKYERLSCAVQKLAQTRAEFSLYSADTTALMHHLLFGVVLYAVVIEACILAVLLMLHLFAYEYQNHTGMAVYTTKIGRDIFRYKLGAGLCASATCFVLLAGTTLFVYCLVFDYSQLWNSSVSSGFNLLSDQAVGIKPFITWRPFTVGGYLAAVLFLALVLTLIFAMMGAVIGLLLRSSYMGTLLFFLAAMAMMTLPYLCSEAGIWGGYFLLQFSPVRLCFVFPLWLTDMGSVSAIPLHELAGLLINILLWGNLIFGFYRYMKRKDMVSCC